MPLRLNLTLAAFVVLALTLGVSSSRAAAPPAPSPHRKTAHFLPSRFNLPFERFKRIGDVYYSNSLVGYYPLYCSESPDGKLAVKVVMPGDIKMMGIVFPTATTREEYLRQRSEYSQVQQGFLFLVPKGKDPLPGALPEVSSLERMDFERLGRVASMRDHIYMRLYDYTKEPDMREIAHDGRLLNVTEGTEYQTEIITVNAGIKAGEYYLAFVILHWGDSTHGKNEGAEVVTNPYIRAKVE